MAHRFTDKRVIEKFEKEAAEMNKRSFKYAWVSRLLRLCWLQLSYVCMFAGLQQAERGFN